MVRGMATLDANRGCQSVKPRSIRHPPPAWVTFSSTFFVTVSTKARGVDQLCLPGVGTCLRATIDERDARGAWRTIAGVLMPDHVHLLIVMPDASRLLPVVTAWKRYTARHLRIRWQRGLFERRLRCNESIAAKIEYIRQNPVRAGLVRQPEDWPFLWLR
jgi:putative transposase